ncbi:unnamed protein product [Diatraea saccharalis]|uniref:Uncharacterized protein n=1 Tax=Diatraea saccharalis TaxID=40085 RepID=A0A9N9N428_9NEOP|nr:unnamed protein product [Diatraea saccharalis]
MIINDIVLRTLYRIFCLALLYILSLTDLQLKDTIVQHDELESTRKNTKDSEYDRYRTILNTLTNYKNKALTNSRPIPLAYTKLESQLKESQNRHNYYLETPLAEFRKLYHSQRSPVSEKSLENKSSGENDVDNLQITSEDKVHDNTEPRIRSARKPKNKEDELEILKDNLTKMYNLKQNHIENEIIPIQETVDDDMDNLDVIKTTENILEVESIISEQTKNNKEGEEAGRELLLVFICNK